jgi:hypothetical protein
LWVITRQISGRKEWYSTDGTRNFFMFRGSYWENLFDPKYYKLFTSAAEGYNYLNQVVKPNYVNAAEYALEEVNNMPMHQMWIITRTPTKLVKAKDKVSDMEIAEGKQYWSKNTSSHHWDCHFSGECTVKFTDKNKANIKAQQLRLHTLIGKFTIAVEEVK